MDMDILLARSRYLSALRLLAVVAASYAIFLAKITLPAQAGFMLIVCVQCWRWSSLRPWVCGFLCEANNISDSEQCAGQPALALKLSNGRWLKAELMHYYCLSWIQILEFRTASSRYSLIVLPDSCSDEEQRKMRCFLLAALYRRRPLAHPKQV